MKLMGANLKLGNTYRIKHKRKGEFVVQLIGIEETTHPTEVDKFFLTCRYDVRVGTDQAHMSFGTKSEKTGQPAPFRVSNLRPTLIDKIEPIKEHWLRELKLPQPKKTNWNRLLDKFKGGE